MLLKKIKLNFFVNTIGGKCQCWIFFHNKSGKNDNYEKHFVIFISWISCPNDWSYYVIFVWLFNILNWLSDSISERIRVENLLLSIFVYYSHFMPSKNLNNTINSVLSMNAFFPSSETYVVNNSNGRNVFYIGITILKIIEAPTFQKI